MVYDFLKIFHIVCAVMILVSMVMNVRTWATTIDSSEKIQVHTLWLILPLAVLQLLTGFTLISLHHENPAQLWIQMSFIGFLMAMISWLVFSFIHSRRWQSVMLFFCGIGVCMMIFAMSNKL